MVLFVDRAAVVGAGVMGARIAEVLALNNVSVVLRDVDEAALHRGLATIEKDLDGLVAFQASKAQRAVEEFEARTGVQLTAEQKEKAHATLKPTFDAERKKRVLGKIQATTSLDPFEKVDLVIEAAPESPALKKKIFQELAAKVPDACVLATNTSTLSVTDLASALPPGRRGRFLGVHFFNPPTTLPLVEVIPGLETRADVVEDLINLLAPMRNHRYPLQPVQVKECPGFLVNRILAPMLQEAFACYEEGIARPKDIDLAMQAGAGMPMGPLALADLIGLDVLLHAGKSIREQQGGIVPQRPVQIVQQLVAAGRLGQKSGRGFYDYTNKPE
ncbi:MAG TPA: 3-hydroxyacyl-CoA dehydrogenase family protein [Candidatus Thermoplasmatota archaeon]|nr:3-hydroxyacyl-CoA dehydrogenase family protein [Candidatus Thermoplasmatota archaeon]